MARSNSYEAMAAAAAERIDQDRALQEQLTLLPDEVIEADDGPKTRGKGKALSQFREWLAQKGFQQPEDQIARIAGLADGRDAIAGAMADAERVVAWAFAGKTKRIKEGEEWVTVEVQPTAQHFLSTFERLYAQRLRAAEALLPYGLTKASPDEGERPPVTVVVAPAPSQDRQMRDVTPVLAPRMVPADVQHQIKQKQPLSETDAVRPPQNGRTE